MAESRRCPHGEAESPANAPAGLCPRCLMKQACERWERKLATEVCGQRGACCRRGFDLLTVSARDRFRKLHPELVQLRNGEVDFKTGANIPKEVAGHATEIRRSEGRIDALTGQSCRLIPSNRRMAKGRVGGVSTIRAGNCRMS